MDTPWGLNGIKGSQVEANKLWTGGHIFKDNFGGMYTVAIGKHTDGNEDW